MTAQLIDGNALAKRIREDVAVHTAALTAQGRQPGLQMRMHWLISGTHSTTASAVPASIASVTSVINLFSAGYNQEGYNAPSAHGVARFSFADICEKPLAASDYLRLAYDYHTILIDRIPVMDYGERNAAKRFISLIDTLYDNGVKLMASAAADPISLYVAAEGVEANEFKRTSSRLIEMSSESYLALPHGRKDSSASGSTTGLVET